MSRWHPALLTLVFGALSAQGEEACVRDSVTGGLHTLQTWAKEVRDPAVDSAVELLKSKGFNCVDETLDPNSARRCVGAIPGYSRKVAIYIPIHYQPVAEPDLITHFHGHIMGNDDFFGTLKRYHLGTELHRSGANKIMVIPESTGKCDTYQEELSSVNQFKKFNASVAGLLKESGLFLKTTPDALIKNEITGHSGAFRAIGNILRETRATAGAAQSSDFLPKKVTLFDATYCTSDGYRNASETNANTACRGIKDFVESHPGTAKSYYIDASPTAAGSERVFSSADRVTLNPRVYTHLTVMNRNYAEAIQ